MEHSLMRLRFTYEMLLILLFAAQLVIIVQQNEARQRGLVVIQNQRKVIENQGRVVAKLDSLIARPWQKQGPPEIDSQGRILKAGVPYFIR